LRSARLVAVLVTAVVAAALEPTAQAADAPVKPDAVIVVTAQAGLFGPLGQFQATQSLALRDGQEFGWRITVKSAKRAIHVIEELTLPAEPKTWGDPEPGIKRKTSADGRSATTELWLQPVQGVIESRWTVTTGDPKGTWVLKVRIEDQPERVFRFQAQ